MLNCPADGFIFKREYENFDLCVLVPDGRIVFILENKVKSLPRIEQLKEYEEKSILAIAREEYRVVGG